jgi:hypothetical protein
VPPAITGLLPSSGYVRAVLGISVPGLGQFVSNASGLGRQDQWELRDTISRHMGRHDLRAGLDYILLRPSRSPGLESILGTASSLQSLLNNDPLVVTYSLAAAYGDNVHIGSVFWQDTFHVGEGLNIVYGLRWEVTPPTGKQVRMGLAPQLTLEAAILREGGFAGIGSGVSVSDLVYVRLSGNNPPGEEKPLELKIRQGDKPQPPNEAADYARAQLEVLIRKFEDEKEPYTSLNLSMWSNRYGEYDDLARIKEWSAAGGRGIEEW